MPNCDTCARHWTPTSMRPDGTCPACGQPLELTRPLRPSAAPATGPASDSATGAAAGPAVGSEEDEAPFPKAPWHFKVLLVGLALYLGWRGVQGIDWIAEHL